MLLLILSTAICATVSAYSSDTDPLLAGWSVWSVWSECSLSCGGGLQTRVRTCDEVVYYQECQGNSLDIEKIACNEWECFRGEWEEWSPCEDGWHYRERCDEDYMCEFEEGECGMEVVVDQEWSQWGVCDPDEKRKTRERCTAEWGCEVDEEACEVAKIVSGAEPTWGAWGPCVMGLKTRFKCSGVNMCTEEEMVECMDSQWSVWGECKAGKQERSRCDKVFGCESEQRPCGAALRQGRWSDWGLCLKGFSSRKKCNAEGLDCYFEERECGDESGAGVWSDWSICKDGFQERDKCDKNMECSLESRPCKEEVVLIMDWSGWGKCGADGHHKRVRCAPDGCKSERRRCSFDGVVREVQEGDGVYSDPELDKTKNDIPEDDFFDYYDFMWEDSGEPVEEGSKTESGFADLLGWNTQML